MHSPLGSVQFIITMDYSLDKGKSKVVAMMLKNKAWRVGGERWWELGSRVVLVRDGGRGFSFSFSFSFMIIPSRKNLIHTSYVRHSGKPSTRLNQKLFSVTCIFSVQTCLSAGFVRLSNLVNHINKLSLFHYSLSHLYYCTRFSLSRPNHTH